MGPQGYVLEFRFPIGAEVVLAQDLTRPLPNSRPWVVVGHKAMWHDRGSGLKYVIRRQYLDISNKPQMVETEVSEIELVWPPPLAATTEAPTGGVAVQGCRPR